MSQTRIEQTRKNVSLFVRHNNQVDMVATDVFLELDFRLFMVKHADAEVKVRIMILTIALKSIEWSGGIATALFF